VTNNKLLMEHAVQYVEERQCGKEVIGLLNHVRLFKKLFLPFELFGTDGKYLTIIGSRFEEQSQIK